MIPKLYTTNPHLCPGNSVITYNQGYILTLVMDSGVLRYCFPRVIGGYTHCSHLLEFTEERTKAARQHTIYWPYSGLLAGVCTSLLALSATKDSWPYNEHSTIHSRKIVDHWLATALSPPYANNEVISTALQQNRFKLGIYMQLWVLYRGT